MFFIKVIKVVVVLQLKRCIANASVFYIIIGKVSYWKKFCLIILLKIDKGLEVDFYHAILSPSLTVSLKVEGNREFLLNA